MEECCFPCISGVFLVKCWFKTCLPILFLDLGFSCVLGFLFLEVGMLSVLSFCQRKQSRLFACFGSCYLFFILFLGLNFVGLPSPIKTQSPKPRNSTKQTEHKHAI